MAAAVPVILGAVGGGAVGYGVATTLALGTVGTAVATATGAVVGAALMAPSPQPMALETDEVPEVDTVDTDDTDVNTSSPTGGSDTTINDVVDLQTGLIDTADTSVAGEQSTGVGEDSAIDFYDRGRQATILTTSQGLLTDAVSGVGTLLKPTPGLASAGLIS